MGQKLQQSQLYELQERSQKCERRLLTSSVCPSASNKSAPTGRLFMKIDILSYVQIYDEQIQLSLKSDKKNGHFTARPIYV